jgi:hypothetical protein
LLVGKQFPARQRHPLPAPSGICDPRAKPIKTSIEEIPDELCQVACAREAVIRPVAAAPHVGRVEIEAAATTLGIRQAYV